MEFSPYNRTPADMNPSSSSAAMIHHEGMKSTIWWLRLRIVIPIINFCWFAGHSSSNANNGGPPNRPLPPTPDEEEMIDRNSTLVMRRVSIERAGEFIDKVTVSRVGFK